MSPDQTTPLRPGRLDRPAASLRRIPPGVYSLSSVPQSRDCRRGTKGGSCVIASCFALRCSQCWRRSSSCRSRAPRSAPAHGRPAEPRAPRAPRTTTGPTSLDVKKAALLQNALRSKLNGKAYGKVGRGRARPVRAARARGPGRDLDGARRVRRRQAQPDRRSPTARWTTPPTGCRTSAAPSSTSCSTRRRRATTRWRNFYIEQSSGRYTVAGDATDWVGVPGDLASYDDNPDSNVWNFLKDSVERLVRRADRRRQDAGADRRVPRAVRRVRPLRLRRRRQLQRARRLHRHLPVGARRRGRGGRRRRRAPSGATAGTPTTRTRASPARTSTSSAASRSATAPTGSASTPSSRRTAASASSPTSTPTTWACPTSTTTTARTAPASGRSCRPAPGWTRARTPSATSRATWAPGRSSSSAGSTTRWPAPVQKSSAQARPDGVQHQAGAGRVRGPAARSTVTSHIGRPVRGQPASTTAARATTSTTG